MPMAKSIDLKGIDSKTNEHLSSVSDRFKISSRGIAGDHLIEPIPNYISTNSEKVIVNKNSWIVLGRDRPGKRTDGYGGSGDTQCASIDMIVGRLGKNVRKVDENNQQLWVDPNFKLDAARIYLSQKTDIDKNFDLVSGKVGQSTAKSGLALKADAIRIIGREGIKLITRTDNFNSQGGKVISVPGIDLIAGNDDVDLQPLVKGQNLTKALERLTYHVDKLNGIVDAFLMSQMEFNEALTHHYHYSPFFSAPTTPAIDVVVPKGIKTLADQLNKVKRSLVFHKINLSSFSFTYFNPAGEKYICSRYNNSN